MSETFFIKPAREGLIVRDPVTGAPLNVDGEIKSRDAHWLRRLAAGDVVEAENTTNPAAVQAAAKPEPDRATNKPEPDRATNKPEPDPATNKPTKGK